MLDREWKRGETSSGPKWATLSRKLTQTEDPGQRPHLLEGHGGGKHGAGLVSLSLLGRGTKKNQLAEIVHQRQDATGKGNGGNKGRCPPLHSKHPLLLLLSGKRVLRLISI